MLGGVQGDTNDEISLPIDMKNNDEDPLKLDEVYYETLECYKYGNESPSNLKYIEE